MCVPFRENDNRVNYQNGIIQCSSENVCKYTGSVKLRKIANRLPKEFHSFNGSIVKYR